jgi:hypothetical protein
VAKRKKKKKKRKSGFLKKSLLAVSCMVLVLCAASITYSFFLRHAGDGMDNHPIRIEVLNGTGESGLANRVARALMKRGIDVVSTGNAENFSHQQTILIARKKNPEIEQLSKILGCRNTIEQLKDHAIIDATLLIGNDFKSLKIDIEEDGILLE